MARKNNLKHVSENETKRLDEAATEIIREINHLFLKAHRAQLTTVSTILKDACESIAWWAAHDHCRESDTEKWTQQLMLESGLHIALELLAKFATAKDGFTREQLLQTIERIQTKDPIGFHNHTAEIVNIS